MNEWSIIRKMARKATTPRLSQYKGKSSSGIALRGVELDLLTSQLHRKLLDSNYRCFFTNIPIELNSTASIDHLNPSSKYPELQSEIDNLVWCHIAINRMKNNMELEDFYFLLQQIKSS